MTQGGINDTDTQTDLRTGVAHADMGVDAVRTGLDICRRTHRQETDVSGRWTEVRSQEDSYATSNGTRKF